MNRTPAVILFLMISLSMACGLKTTEVNNSAIEGGSGQSTNNSAINFKTNNAVEKKETSKNEQISDLPKFEKQENYKTSVREKLLKTGWTPAQSVAGKENCSGQESLCKELPELEAGPSSPLGQAILRWKKADKILLVRTIDSFLFDGYEFEKTEKSASIPNVEGTYVYSYQHDSGADTFIWELKKGNVATYVSEREGGDGADRKGTWKLNDSDSTITVSFPDAPDDAETYVFKIEGKNLKMTKEPKMPQGVRGFSGKVFKRK